MIEHIFNEALQLRQKKWHDYNGSFADLFKKYGWSYVTPRLVEKLARLEALTLGGKEDSVGESVRDTLMDIGIICFNTIEEMGRVSAVPFDSAYNDEHSCDTCEFLDLDFDMPPCDECYHGGRVGNDMTNRWEPCED